MSLTGNPLTCPYRGPKYEEALAQEIDRRTAEGVVVTRLGLTLWLRDQSDADWLSAYQFINRYCDVHVPEMERGSASDYRNELKQYVDGRWKV